MGVLVDVFDEHDLVDDLGIAFTRYPFEIDVEVVRSAVLGDYASELLRLVPMILGNAVSQKLGCECMVVENHQRVIKTFG